MPIFITQGRYTQQAMRGMVANPEDRLAEVKALIERHGGKFIAWYMTLGEYDWMTISENADPTASMAAAAVATAGGGVTDVRTTIAFSGPDAKRAFETAKASASQFRSAGS